MTIVDRFLDGWHPNNRCSCIAKRCACTVLGLVGWYFDMVLKALFSHLYGLGIGVSDTCSKIETSVQEMVAKKPRRGVLYIRYLSRLERQRVERTVLNLDQATLDRHPGLVTSTKVPALREPATWPWIPCSHLARQKQMLKIHHSKQTVALNQAHAQMNRHVMKRSAWKRSLVKTSKKAGQKLNKRLPMYTPHGDITPRGR